MILSTKGYYRIRIKRRGDHGSSFIGNFTNTSINMKKWKENYGFLQNLAIIADLRKFSPKRLLGTFM